MTESTFSVSPIGIIHSCFKEKFGIPRQPGRAAAARATLEMLSPYDRDEAFKGLETFSHLWIIFIFHGISNGQWRPTVRPPRLGGNRRSGVFATRSGFRPNRIGMSVVALDSLHRVPADTGRLAEFLQRFKFDQRFCDSMVRAATRLNEARG